MSTSRTREKADGELFKSTGIDDNATSTAVTIDASEIVTVGSTVSPALKVNRQSANGDAYIELQSNGTKVANLVGSSVGGFSVHTGASGTLTTALAIDNSGNVGIGRSSALNYNAGGTLKNLSIDAGTSTDARAEISLAGGGGGANYSLGRINFGLSSNTTNAAVGINGYSSAAGASTGGNLIFSTASNISSGSYQERMRIDSSGHAIIGGGVTLGNGQTYAAANTLSDYEEGTFVATLRGSVSDPSTAATTTSMYRKIGETVYIQIAFENWNTAGASGQIQVTGLPFTSSPTGRFFISNSFYEGASWPSSGVPTAYVEANGTRIQCFTIRSSDAWTDTSHNASGSTYFWFAGTYPTGA